MVVVLSMSRKFLASCWCRNLVGNILPPGQVVVVCYDNFPHTFVLTLNEGNLTYVEGWKAIEMANSLFGFEGWSCSVELLTPDFVCLSNLVYFLITIIGRRKKW